MPEYDTGDDRDERGDEGIAHNTPSLLVANRA
jgi:hypothetical protein